MTFDTTQPRLNHVQCLDAVGLHRMAYWEWGDPHNPDVVICVHGLSRQGRDFDGLAKALSSFDAFSDWACMASWEKGARIEFMTP